MDTDFAKEALETIQSIGGEVKGIKTALDLLKEDLGPKVAELETFITPLTEKLEGIGEDLAALKQDVASGSISGGEPGHVRDFWDNGMTSGARKLFGTTRTAWDAVPKKIMDATAQYVQASVLAGCVGNLSSSIPEYRQKMENIRKEMDDQFMTKALTGGSLDATVTATEGGELVPTPFEAIVLRQIEDSAVVRSRATIVPMTAHTHQIPALDTNPTVAIVAEEATIGQAWSQGPFSQKNLVAKKLATMVAVTGELVQDNAVLLLQLISTLFSEAFAVFEDDQSLEGDGTGANFTGLVAAGGVNEVINGSNGATVSYVKLVEQVYKAGKRISRRNAGWFMNPQQLEKIIALNASGTPVLYRQDVSWILSQTLMGGQGLGEGTILGFPVFTSDQIATTRVVGSSGAVCSNIYFGPMDTFNMIYGDLLGMQFASTDTHASTFATFQITIRALKRMGILVGIPKNFTKQTGVKLS